MRCFTILDKRLFRYVSEKKSVALIAIALALGLILIFIGSRDDDDAVSPDESPEQRLSTACSAVDGVGECTVLVYYSPDSKEKEIESVIVICDGADSVDVRLRLTEMLSSFYGIGANRIRIEKRKPV